MKFSTNDFVSKCEQHAVKYIKTEGWINALIHTITPSFQCSLLKFLKTSEKGLKGNGLESFIGQKQPPRGVLRKRCSKNMQQIYRRTPMPKCDFSKVAKQLY